MRIWAILVHSYERLNTRLPRLVLCYSVRYERGKIDVYWECGAKRNVEIELNPYTIQLCYYPIASDCR